MAVRTLLRLFNQGQISLHRSYPILIAAKEGCTDIVNKFIAHDSVLKDSNNGSVLMVAVAQGHTEVVRILIDAGANKNVSYNGQTALDIARRNGNTDIIRLLGAVSPEDVELEGLQ